MRAIAILCVLEVHFGSVAYGYLDLPVPWAMGYIGGLGVELFFVLSGFLIGGLLLDVAERSPTWRGCFTFLVRRWMRTLPLYILWIAVLMVIMRPPSRGEYAVAYLTFTQNLFWPMPPGDWFGVSWSISIEEWFYLLFSSLLLGLTALWRRGAMIVTCLLFLVVPLVLRYAYSDIQDIDGGIRKVVAFRLDAIIYGVVAIWCCRRYPAVVAQLRGILFRPLLRSWPQSKSLQSQCRHGPRTLSSRSASHCACPQWPRSRDGPARQLSLGQHTLLRPLPHPPDAHSGDRRTQRRDAANAGTCDRAHCLARF